MSAPEIGFLPDSDFDCIPYRGFSASNYEVKACPHAQVIEHGDTIDLGDKALEVMHLPGHSSGSVGLYNPANQHFYSGDVVYDGYRLDQIHVHFDHSGGCHEFDQVYIHQNEHHALCQGDQQLILSAPEIGFVPDSDFDCMTSNALSPKSIVSPSLITWAWGQALTS